MTSKHNILIDVGVSMKRINEALLISEGIDLDDISFIYISHSHSDHLLSLQAIYNKYKHITFIMNKNVYTGVLEVFKREFNSDRFIFIDEELKGNDLDITLFPLKHDVPCYGINVYDHQSQESLCFIADNGESPYSIKDIPILHIPHTYYMVESNYDNFMQYTDTTRNELLKRRVLSSHGHSDNFNAIEKVVNMMEWSENTECKGIMFTHLSEHCNTEDIAMQSHQAYITTWGKKTLLKDIPIKYARQNEIVRL